MPRPESRGIFLWLGVLCMTIPHRPCGYNACRRHHVEIAQAVSCSDIPWTVGGGNRVPWLCATAFRSAARGASGIRRGACRWTRGLALYICRGGEAGAGSVDRTGAIDGGKQLASDHGGALRAAHRTTQGGTGNNPRAGVAMESYPARL